MNRLLEDVRDLKSTSVHRVGDLRRQFTRRINKLAGRRLDEKRDLLRHTIFLFLVVVYVLLRVFFLTYGKIYQFSPDTIGYLNTADLSVLSTEFYSSYRAFVYPLLIKVLGKDFLLVVCAQFVISIISWVALAWYVQSFLGHHALKLTAGAFILMFGLSPNITMWDNVVIPESLTLSMLVLWVMAFLHLCSSKSGWGLLWFVLLSFVLANLKFIAVYLLLFTSASLLLFFVDLRNLRFATAATFLILIFLLAHFSANQGYRHVVPLLNNIQNRIMLKESWLGWFGSRGMPVNETVLRTKGTMAWEVNYRENTKLQEYFHWVMKEGKQTYVSFMLTHPGYLLLEPLKEIRKKTWSPNLFSYKYLPTKITKFQLTIHRVVYSHSFVPVFFVMIVYVFVKLSEGHLDDPAISLLLIGLMTYIIGWLGDPAEISRHVLPASLLLRIGGVFCVVGLIKKESISTAS